MKSYLFTAVVIFSVGYQKCRKQNLPVVPACIQAKIDSISKQPNRNPPLVVEEYIYRGRRVFAFNAECCDRYNEVFDADCRYQCAPSGGYTGRGDGGCPDYKDSAQFVRKVYPL